MLIRLTPTRTMGSMGTMSQTNESETWSNIATSHDGSRTCDCIKCVKRDPARFRGNANGDVVQTRFGARGGRTVHLTSRSCGTYAFCGADVGHGFATISGAVDSIRRVKFCKKCVNPDALAIAFGLIAFAAWARAPREAVRAPVTRGATFRIIDRLGVEYVGRVHAAGGGATPVVEAGPEALGPLLRIAARDPGGYLGTSVLFYLGNYDSALGGPYCIHVTITGAKLIELAITDADRKAMGLDVPLTDADRKFVADFCAPSKSIEAA